MNRKISLKQLIALSAVTTGLGAISSSPTFAAVVDSRKADYTIEKHQALGGEICGTHRHKGHQLADMPVLTQKMRTLKKSKAAQGIAGSTGGKYTIPVVVHVFGEAHNCDADNGICVTDETVIDALKTSNEDFQGLTTLDGPIAPEFAAIRENMNIEFVLAKVDPEGNPTSGIIRHGEAVGHGNGGANEPVQTAAWDNFKYMNIYIVNDLYGNGSLNSSGVAWYPNTAMSEQGLARVVYNGSYLGKNSNENFRSVFTHEFGHWLNLAHTFDGGACAASGETFCSMEGDKVCDTPQIASSSPQDNAPNCLGQPTNTENFMHYTNNYAMFTQQQVDRMTAALYHPSRSTLWTDENLTATGLADHITDVPAWDGSIGLDSRPPGEVIFEQTDISGKEGDVTTFEVSVPEGTRAISVYLDGFEQDPDMYVAHGHAPIDENGRYDQDLQSFNAPGSDELINILTPKTDGKYYIAVHAYSDYDNARLSVVSVEDTSSCAQCDRVLVGELKDLYGTAGEAPVTASYEIPAGAKAVSVEMPTGYWGDADIYVSRNAQPTYSNADCNPWKASGVREICEFHGDDVGGVYNIMVDAYSNYGNVNVNVHYTMVNPESDAENTAPVAKLTSSTALAQVGHIMEFSSEGSSDIDGNVASYHWDFGDGNSSTSANPVHTYQQTGNFTVTLTVTDEDGGTGSSQSQVAVSRVLDHCEVTAENENHFVQNVQLADLNAVLAPATTNGYANLTAHTANLMAGDYELTLLGINNVYDTVPHHWNVWMDFNGDNEFSDDESVASFVKTGASTQTITVPAEAKGTTGTMRIAVAYVPDATEETMLSACGHLENGEYKDLSFHVNADPVAEANGTYAAAVGNAIAFSSEGSMDAEGDVTYAWDFGDGNTSTEANPSHAYASAGSFTVTLTVTDSNGVTASDSTTANVVTPEQPQVVSSSSGGGGSMGIFSALALLLLGARRKLQVK